MRNKFLKLISLLGVMSISNTILMAEVNQTEQNSNIAIETENNIDNDVENMDGVLTVQNAIDRAIRIDTTLIKYNRDLKVYEQELKNMREYGSEARLYKVIDIDETNQKIEFQKDKIEKNITDQYQSIILLQKNIDLISEQIKFNETRVKQAELQLRKGYIKEDVYDKAVTALEDSKVTKLQTERNLKDLKNSFNKTVLCEVDDYRLQINDTYEPFTLETSINGYAEGKATLMMEFSVERVKVMENRFWDKFAMGPAQTYDVYLKAESEVENTKDMIENTHDNYVLMIESQYTNLKRQMDTIDTKKKDIETALKDEKILDIRYKNGYISKMDYESQKMSILSKEVDYLSEIYRYNIMKMQVEKPWVMN